jgi:hypothetical protein
VQSGLLRHQRQAKAGAGVKTPVPSSSMAIFTPARELTADSCT